MGRKNAAVKIACENRKARHDYFIHETYEAGLELKGTEVKSLRAGKANLKDSYGEIKNGEVFIQNMHISPYEQEISLTMMPCGLGSFCCIRQKL